MATVMATKWRQLGSNCKSNEGETEVNYPIIIIFPTTGFINQKPMKLFLFRHVLATKPIALFTPVQAEIHHHVMSLERGI